MQIQHLKVNFISNTFWRKAQNDPFNQWNLTINKTSIIFPYSVYQQFFKKKLKKFQISLLKFFFETSYFLYYTQTFAVIRKSHFGSNCSATIENWEYCWKLLFKSNQPSLSIFLFIQIPNSMYSYNNFYKLNRSLVFKISNAFFYYYSLVFT